MVIKTSHKLISAAVIAAAIAISSQVAPAAHVGPDVFYPNPDKTPGSLNADVTQANIQQTICVSGWTNTIRPASSYTSQLKMAQLRQEGYALYGDMEPSHYEEDHFVSLELGGNPIDPQNLWPEPYFSTTSADGGQVVAFIGAHQKDQVENLLHKEVCSGQLTLAQAQAAVMRDWYALYANGSSQREDYTDNDDE